MTRRAYQPGTPLDGLGTPLATEDAPVGLVNRGEGRGDGEHWLPPSFSTGWSRFAAKAGLFDVPLLGLRRGSATLMLASGVPDVVAAQIMGHADARILRRYQDIVPELTRDAAARMSTILGE
jgi:integrase